MSPLVRESILVILPGSMVTTESVSQLAAFAQIDEYQARLKLSAKFPMPIGLFDNEELNGPRGEALDHLGVKFFAIDRTSYEAAFEGFVVHSCEFESGEIRFRNRESQVFNVRLDDPVYLIELRYKEEKRTKNIESRRIPLSTRASGIQTTTANNKSAQIQQVLHLYVLGHQHPLIFVDSQIDYSTLGVAVEAQATWNFLRLKGTLEQVFEIKADRTLVEYSFAAQQVCSEIGTMYASGSKKESQESSNVDSANLFSRILYAAWIYGLRS